MKITTIDQKSPYLEEIISLSRSNAEILGFLPRGAFIKYATDNQIFVALNDDKEVLGYLLYGISYKKMLVYIVHLCVKSSERGKGIARRLFEKLRDVTKDAFWGIRVRCRRDYEVNKLWPKLGFVAVTEIPGRSKTGSTLNVWWFDNECPTLFTYAETKRDESKLRVVIDANVFFQLQEPLTSLNEESHALLADWLQENIELCVTKELLNEIDRHENSERRQSNRVLVRKFTMLSDAKGFQRICEDLRSYFPDHMRTSDESDLRQLARAIAAGVQFFVTLDDDLLDKEPEIYTDFGMHIIRPSELIIDQDRLMRESEYQPIRLAGSHIKVERVQPEQISLLEEIFLAPQGERKGQFRQLLHTNLADPQACEADVIRNESHPLALIVYDRRSSRSLEIPVFRILKESLSATLARHLVLHTITMASEEKRDLIKVLDSYLPADVVGALREFEFVFVEDECAWIKANLAVVETAEELSAKLRWSYNEYPEAKDYFQSIADILETACSNKNFQTILHIERLLWPAKITNVNVPAFIVPIKPKWAMNLFDTGLAKQNLFGGNLSLIFNVENVYYRTKHPKILSAPARILWYVSQGRGNYQGAMSIRACSYLDEVVIDKPKTLFPRFRRLGVYKWQDVFEVAKEDLDQEIMAFRFSYTEVFKKPVSRNDLQKVWQKETGRNFHIQSPLAISSQRFFQFYKKGMGLAGG